MKKLILLLCLGIVVTSCQSRESAGAFDVSGKILKIKGHKVFLESLVFNSQNPAIVDSGSVKPDGSYQLKTVARDEGLYRLVVDNQYQVLFINDNDHITINVDPDKMRHPDIEGSEASTALYNFLGDYTRKDSLINATYILIDSLNKREIPIKKQDSVINSLNTKRTEQIAQLNDLVKNFIKNANSPAAISYAIVQGTRSMEPSELLPIAQSAANRFKDNSGLATLMSLLKVNAADNTSASDNYPLLGKPAPDLAMKNPEGQILHINQFRGKYLLVDFWASWCGPCRQENPNVVAAYNKYKNRNFTILGVSLDKDKASWIQAIQHDKLNWNQMSDLKFWESEAVKTYGFDGIPFNVLIDPNGKIIASSLRGDDLDKKLAEVLK